MQTEKKNTSNKNASFSRPPPGAKRETKRKNMFLGLGCAPLVDWESWPPGRSQKMIQILFLLFFALFVRSWIWFCFRQVCQRTWGLHFEGSTRLSGQAALPPGPTQTQLLFRPGSFWRPPLGPALRPGMWHQKLPGECVHRLSVDTLSPQFLVPHFRL